MRATKKSVAEGKQCASDSFPMKKINRKGKAQFIDYAMGFGIGIVGLVIVVILLQSLKTTSSACPALYTYNGTADNCYLTTNASVTGSLTYAGNITNDGLSFADNFSSQWGLAGTILGYVFVLAILALIGVGAYAGYNKIRGSR